MSGKKAEKHTFRVGLVTLGCAKNQVDSEYMLGALERAGFELTGCLHLAEAIVVNTCGFIRPAKEESIEAVLEAARFKKKGRCKVLAVVGCLAQRYAGQLARELPEVDFFLGVGPEQYTLPGRLARALGAGLEGPRSAARLVDTAAQGWAYLKISEGCDNRCAYCAIPLIRGNLVSRTEKELLDEARMLEKLGVVELNLIAQDVTAYGMDRPPGQSCLTGLLETLLQGTAIPWIRMLYAHPAHLDEKLLRFMAGQPRILRYLDLPVQQISDRILERMGRKVGSARIRELIARARDLMPDIVLRSTVLVGYPGETVKDFELLLEFVEQTRFDHLGGFIYSREEDTAAARLTNRPGEAEKSRRLEMILDLQRQISAEQNAALVGRLVPVLVEKPLRDEESTCASGDWAGRTRGQAPEVDGQVFVEGKKLRPGSIVQVKITASDDYDLFGKAGEKENTCLEP